MINFQKIGGHIIVSFYITHKPVPSVKLNFEISIVLPANHECFVYQPIYFSGLWGWNLGNWNLRVTV